MINRREIVISIILSLVTCGIYGIIWMVGLNDDVKTVSGDTSLPSGGVVFLLTLVTCGIYGIYWYYKMGELMKTAYPKYGMEVKDNAILYLILGLFGLGIVNYIIIQSDLNTIADKSKGVA
jgi:hypothetical protein